MFHQLLLRTVSPFVATANITLLCAWPGAVVMQTGYPESSALLLIVLAVRWMMLRHRPWRA